MTKPHAIALYRTRLRWTADDAREALSALARSGLSLLAFAAREGLDPQRLYLWRRKLAGKALVAGPKFVELRSRGVERIEVVLGGGATIRIPESFETETLRRVIEVLDASRSC
jgi:hypothetical protein